MDGLLTLIAMTYGRLGDLLVLLRYPEQLQGPSREFNAQLETASLKKMKDWRTLLLQYLLQQNRSVTGEDKVATDASECKQYCGMPLLTDLAVMMRIDPLALIHRLREFVTVVYGPVMSFVIPDVQVKAYRNSVLYVNLVSVVDCSVLNWVEQRELRGLASDDRLFVRIAEPGWMLMDFNNHFKCRMGREELSHIQFNPKLWNLRPVVKDTGAAMGVPLLPEAYAHAKENQQAWLSGSRPLPDQCPRYPPIRRMLLGVTTPIIAPRIGAARDAEKRMLKWSEGMEPRFIGWNVAAAHTFDFSFPDAWSRKKIKALPSRRPEVSAEMWNEVYSPTDDLSRLKWSGEVKVVMLEVAKESRGGSYITVEDLAPHGEESVEFLVNDELFYHAGDMTVPARPDSGIDSRQGPSGPRPKPDAGDDELMDQDDDDDIEGKTGKPGETDLGALERDLLEYRFSEDDDGEVDGSLLLMTPSSFMSPTKEASADLSPIDPISQARECRSRDPQKLLHESPRRRKIEAKKLPVRRARKGLKRLKGKTGGRAMNPRVVKSRASAVVTSLTSAGRSGESGQGDSATLTGGEKENLIPPMLLAGLTRTAVRSKKTARTLADTKLEMEIISQCGSGGLEDYRPSRTNIAKLKLEGQLDVVEYSRVTVQESVHMGDPAGGYVEMLKARNSARGHLMAWSEKRAMQEYLKELTENSNLNRQEYGTVMSSEANEIGLERLLEISWRAALQRYFDESMHAPATVAAYLAHPCMRTDLQVRLAWCLMGIKKAEYEASNDSKSREQELELMEALRALILKDDSAIAWAKHKDALCFVRFVVDRIPTPVLGECIKIIRQKGVDCERNFLRALLELYQDMPLTVPNKESNDMESYRKLEEVRSYSNKELKVSRELIEAVKGQKEFPTLGKLKSFQYVSGIPGMAYNPFVNEEAREAYFDYEQVIVLNFWVERIKKTGMLMVEQPKLGIILEDRVVEPSVSELKGQVSFDCGSWDGPLKTSLVTMWELMKPSWCPHPNAALIWDMTADITLDLDDDASLHDLAMIHHLLAMRLTKRKSTPSTELSEEGPSSNWLKQGTCLAQHSGMEGHVCNLGHCLVTLSEQHRQLARLYGRLSMSDKSGMELVADCHGVTDVNLITALGFCSMTSSIESLERLERAHELVTSLSVEVFPGALQTEQKIGGWREALENEMNLKDSEAYHKPTGSKFLVGSSSAPYCSSRYPTHMVVMDARTQQVLIDQLFSVPKCVRLARMSERSYDLLAKIFRAVPKRSKGELQDVVGEEFLRLNEGNVSEFQKQKASGALPTEFPTIEEKDDLHRILMEVEPLLGASGYRTRRNIVRTHGEYPCHCLAQTLWYPKRGNLMLVWDVEELYSTGLPDQNQQVSIVVVSAMLAVRWLEANADTSEQEMAVPTPEQLSNVKMSHELDLFRTTCKVLRIPKAIERIWSRQGLMPWFRAVMTSWMYERAKRHMSRNTEAYQSFQLNIGPGAYKRAFLTHRNAVTTAVKRVAGAPCVTEDEKKEVLRADLERNVSLCLHNSFCRNREQKVNVDLLTLLQTEAVGTGELGHGPQLHGDAGESIGRQRS